MEKDSSWVYSLLSEKFFAPCIAHESFKKNERNVFCLDCRDSGCPQCISFHQSHRLLQIRRYVYQDVVRLEDIEKLFDCGSVQPYITNSAKVVFINQRPQSRSLKGSAGVCITCERSLQQPYHFCSLFCKVQYHVQHEGCISRFVYECDSLPLSDLEDGQMTPSAVLDGGASIRTSSGSSANGGVGCRTESCTATTEGVTRKKRTPTSMHFPVAAGNVSRQSPGKRKGVPFRSPLF